MDAWEYVAVWNDVVIARSADTVVVDSNHYFPADSVDEKYLKDSKHISRCGWKGVANYYNLIVNGKANENACWYYPNPKPAAAKIKGRIAFWKGVVVKKVEKEE